MKTGSMMNGPYLFLNYLVFILKLIGSQLKVLRRKTMIYNMPFEKSLWSSICIQ